MTSLQPEPDRETGVRSVIAYRIAGDGGAPAEEQCRVVEENALTIDVEDVGVYMLMWTPTQPTDFAMGYTRWEGVLGTADNPEALALAVGFCFTEGLIGGLEELRTIAMCPDASGVLRVQLADPAKVSPRRRNVAVNSSCGICGGREAIESGLAGLAPVPDRLRLGGEQLERLMLMMRSRQDVFVSTGGAHAAAVFSSEGNILAAAEDLGRHNALDKVIGACLLQRLDLAACGVLLSSRLSFEMVMKAARAKFELIAAVSAPTSLAIEVANRCGITLCGFVREGRATVYTHPQRIKEMGGAVRA